MNKKYDSSIVEKKWQEKWNGVDLYGLDDKAKNKFYNLWMFPYPSAEGLHAGHAFASTGSDVYGRFMRMNGKSVFQPIGYDSFGIHSENFAIKINEHPGEVIKRTTVNYEKQMRSLGHGYDWNRTVTTSDIEYYRWTQWIFVQMFKAGLAYRRKSEVNWCPSCKTVLADEQVMTPKQAGKDPKNADGSKVDDPDQAQVCERCGTVVERKDLDQWFFRITDYADRLLDNLEKIDWSPRVVIAQQNWIGKKTGINIKYQVVQGKGSRTEGSTPVEIECFTTRPDTNFGATFVVLAPEHPLAEKITTKENKQKVSKYINLALKKSKEERIVEGHKKTGVFTGSYAINNLNGYRMPIWVTDFVLADVGTGAVVGVPGHDKRDFQFAQQYNLPIKRVVIASDGDKSEITKLEQVQEDEGIMVNSEFLNGMKIQEAKDMIMDHLEEKGWGIRTKHYHLRDWLISRQRYWGPPIPMIYCENCAKKGKGWFNNEHKNEKTNEKAKPSAIKDDMALLHVDQSDWDSAGWYPAEELPVELPFLKDYKPKGTGRGPLADHPEFYETVCPACGSKARRETDVSDTFLDSAWYFLRYPSVGANSKSDAGNADIELPWSSDLTKNWLPVDLYFGGAEHAVLHLMYARFLTMMLNDLGLIEFEEPFPKFFAHGLMIKDGAKMSKSRGNVVNPDHYIEKFGADTLRLYTMFMGPMDGYPDFRDTGIEGMRRFVDKLWKLFNTNKVNINKKDSRLLDQKMHQTIKKVTEDIEEFKYNTAIAAIMEYVNLLKEQTVPAKHPKLKETKNNEMLDSDLWHQQLQTLCQLLAPFAPHLAEEVWCNVLGQKFSVHTSDWPKFDEKLAQEEIINIAVQVNGKLRSTIQVSLEDSKDKAKVIELVRSDEKVKKWLDKKTKKEIFVPGRLVNLVI